MKKLTLLIALTMTIGIYSQTTMRIWKGGIKVDSIAVTNDLKLTFIVPTSTFTCGTSTVDYGGQTYHTVQIGTQCWLKENLNVGIMINGTQEQTNNSTIEKYCHSNDPANCTAYGGLYQWNEAMEYLTIPGAKGICPTGWHIPMYAELQKLDTAVSHSGIALKAVGQGIGIGAGTNVSGFSAMLAGYRSNDGSFGSLGVDAYFGSSTEHNALNEFFMYLYYSDSSINYSYDVKEYGFSVRCVRDF